MGTRRNQSPPPAARSEVEGIGSRLSRRTLGWLLLATGALVSLGIVLIGDLLTHDGPRASGELAIADWFAEHRFPAADHVALTINLVLGPVLGPVLVALGCLVVGLTGRWRPALTMAAVTGLTWLSTGVTKLLVARPRPSYDDVHAVLVERGHDSFPSGHTAFATAIVVGLVAALLVSGRRIGPTLLVGGLGIAVVATSRLYLGVHFLGDVVAAVVQVLASTAGLVGLSLLLQHRWPRLRLWLPRRPALPETQAEGGRTTS